MKRFFFHFQFFLFLLFFSHFLWGGERKILAIIPVFDSRIDSSDQEKVGHEISLRLNKIKDLRVVGNTESSRALSENFKQLLQKETGKAFQLYYHFRFSEAEALMVDREDSEALKLKILIRYSQGQEAKAKALCKKLAALDSQVKLSSKEFPPKIRGLWEEILREGKRQGQGALVSHLKLGEMILPTSVRLEKWQGRLQLLGKPLGWEKIFLYRVDSVGWNKKITAYLFDFQNSSHKTRSVELVSLQDMREAAKVLINPLFNIDSPVAIH